MYFNFPFKVRQVKTAACEALQKKIAKPGVLFRFNAWKGRAGFI
jgi:hypothetical protein